jgi:N utilization substance protein B
LPAPKKGVFLPLKKVLYKMLSRRLLRVKVMQMVYAYYKNGDSSIQKVEKELFHSISKSFELYHLYLLLLVEIRLQEEKRIDQGRQKRVPSHEDLNPNTRFIDNRFLKQLTDNRALLRYIDNNGISWSNHPEIVKNIISALHNSPIYQEYMSAPECDYELDRKLVLKLVEKIIAPCDELYSHFEEQSIYWNDEVEFVISMVIKSIKEFNPEKGEEQVLLPEFKDEDDRDFVKTLFRKSILNYDEYSKLIDQYTKNWELERVAFIDVVLMQIALAEISEFVNIPVKVTLNEYIELAKHYSTSKSGVFINGVLDKVVSHLKNEKKIFKTGRGLMEE